MQERRARGADLGATLGLLAIGLLWGFNWAAVKLALHDMSVWSMRACGLGLGAALLFALAATTGRSLRVPRRERPALFLAGLLNVTAFNLLSATAQTLMPTSRAAILAYTMPVWAAVLARLFLHERFDRWKWAALALGGAGLAIVVAPLAPHLGEGGTALGVLAILGSAWSWAAGTILTKKVGFTADPVATTAWQLLVGAVSALAGLLVFALPAGTGHILPLTAGGWAGLLYNGVLGIALGYFLWFGVVARLPASTAAIGVLIVPVVGVVSAMLVVGDRPTGFDAAGFVLILAAVVVNMRSAR